MIRFALASLCICSFAAALMAQGTVIYVRRSFVAGGGGDPTFIVDQDFEETGVPTEGDPDLWSCVVTICDWDESTVVLSGSESLELNNAGSGPRGQVKFPAGESDIFIRIEFRVSSSGNNNRMMSYRTGSEIAWIEVNTAALCINDGGGNHCTVSTLSIDTKYNVWMRYTAGSGSDGFMSIAFTTSGTEPTSGNDYISLSDSPATASPDRLQFRLNSLSGESYYFDEIKVADEPIGSL